jgi:hypothetical protein
VLDITDIDSLALDRPNASLPVGEIETIRALNAIHHRRGSERSPALRHQYLAHRAVLPTVSVTAAIRAHVGSLRLDEEASQFSSIYRDLINRHGRMIIPPRDRSGLHAPRAIDVPFVRTDHLLDRMLRSDWRIPTQCTYQQPRTDGQGARSADSPAEIA